MLVGAASAGTPIKDDKKGKYDNHSWILYNAASVGTLILQTDGEREGGREGGRGREREGERESESEIERRGRKKLRRL